jgi:WD40 repeat protein
LAASDSGNVAVMGFTDDSLVMLDARQKYNEMIWLEIGCHQDTVKSVVWLEKDFLCLTGGSDCKLKLWDLRNKKCIGDYGGNDG